MNPTQFTISEWAMIIQVLHLLATALVAVFVWFTRRSAAQRDALAELGKDLHQAIAESNKDLDERLDILGDRMTRVESDLENRSTDAEVRGAHKRLSKVWDKVSATDARVAALEATLHANTLLLNNIDAFLRESDR